ncbi:MAG: tetratricopeptide repeat protein [Acidobacteriota bacterium]
MFRLSPYLIAGALLTLIAMPVWAQTGLLRGTVVDVDNEPIPGVKVTVTSKELTSFRKTFTTDKRGQFKVRFQSTHMQYTFDILFEKPGYGAVSQPMSPSSTQQMKERYVLERGETQVVEKSRGDLSAVLTGTANVAIESFNAGLTAQREGDLATARSKYEAALAEDPELGPAYVGLAQVLLDQGEYAGAAEASDKALALDVNRAEPLRIKYQSLRALGRNDEAEVLAASLEEAEGAVASARRIYNEGGVAFQADDKETALAKFQEAANLDPSLVDAHHAVATLQLAKGNYEEAATSAERALNQGSDDLRTLRVLYDAYDALNRTEELTEIAPRLAAVDPDFGGSKLVEQAAELWNGGHADKAVALSHQALAIDPNIAKAYYFIGLNHLSGGKNAEAKAALQKFVDMAPDDPEAATAKEMMSYIQ